MSDNQPVQNTDREIWRGPDEGNGSYYADSIHVTQEGSIGINCGGFVFVKPARDWHALALRASAPTPDGDKMIQRAIGRQEGHDQCRKEVLAALDSGIPRQSVASPSTASTVEPVATACVFPSCECGDGIHVCPEATDGEEAVSIPTPSAARTVEPMAIRDMIAAIIEPDALAEYNAEFAKKPGGPTYTMMANYPQVKAARDKADAILAALAALADPRNDRGSQAQ